MPVLNTNQTNEAIQIKQNGPFSFNRDRKRPKQLLTQKIAKEKQMEIQEEIKEHKRRKPKNLLFTTGYSSEESLEIDSDNENNT